MKLFSVRSFSDEIRKFIFNPKTTRLLHTRNFNPNFNTMFLISVYF